MAKVYLSSTYRDLIEHREAAYRALRQMRHDVISMEDYGASDERPLERCLDDVSKCDVYTGVFAWRYGFVPEGRSAAITHLEYDHAGENGIPRLIFLAAEDAPWPPSQMDEDLARIRKLRARLQLDHVVTFFNSAEDLARAISVAIANVVERTDDRAGEGAGAADTAFLRRSLTHMAADLEDGIRFYWNVSRGIFALGVVLLLAGAFAQNLILGVGAMLIVGFAVFPLATMISTRRKKDVLNGYGVALAGASPAPETMRLVHLFLTRQLAA
jgi:hypothetical protein